MIRDNILIVQGDMKRIQVAFLLIKKVFFLPIFILIGGLILPLYSHGNNQLDTVLERIAQQERLVKDQQNKLQKLQQQLAAQDKSIAQSSKLLHQTELEIANLNADIKKLQSSIGELNSQQKIQQEYLSKQMLAAFKLGKNSGLQLILVNKDRQRNDRILSYYNYLNEYRQKLIKELGKTQTALGERQDQLKAKQKKQQTLLSQRQTEQNKLTQIRMERQKTLDELDSSLKKGQVRLTELKNNEKKLRNQLAKAEREAKVRAEREAKEASALLEKQKQAKQRGSNYVLSDKDRQLLARSGGLGQPQKKFEWPVKSRKILHHFGENQLGELTWKAMIIASAEGSEVQAIADGIVMMSGWLAGYGYVIAIDHGNNDMSLYGYNQTSLVSLHQPVKAGQVIGLVGVSQEQKRAALYFEIRRKGQAVNPQIWLKGN